MPHRSQRNPKPPSTHCCLRVHPALWLRLANRGTSSPEKCINKTISIVIHGTGSYHPHFQVGKLLLILEALTPQSLLFGRAIIPILHRFAHIFDRISSELDEIRERAFGPETALFLLTPAPLPWIFTSQIISVCGSMDEMLEETGTLKQRHFRCLADAIRV